MSVARTWILALGLAVAALLSLEATWRFTGHVPSVTDDRDLWSAHRARASNCENALVIIGASRSQTGCVPSVLREAFPRHDVVHLAIDGHQPASALQDLAHDPSFRGTVLCDLSEFSLLGAHWDDQADYVRYYHREWSLYKRIDRDLRTAVQTRLTVVHPSVGLREMIRSAVLFEWPRPYYMVTSADRWRRLDYSKTDTGAQLEYRVRALRSELAAVGPEPVVAWNTALARIAHLVAKIEARGGRVIFIKFPTSGEFLRIEKQSFPDEIYWSQVSSVTGAPAIDCNKEPSLSRFTCPDGSHLDVRDAPEFTRALAALLVRTGAVGP